MIISWVVPPAPSASGLLAEQILNALGSDNCTLIGELPKSGEALHPEVLYFDPRIFSTDRGLRYFKWLSWWRFIRLCSSIIKRKSYDKILAIFPDEFYATSAVHLGKKHSLPVHLWMHNSYKENRSGIFLVLAGFLQQYIFNHAKSVNAISEGLTDFYQKNYPHLQVKLLAHGFKIPNPVPQPIRNDKAPSAPWKFLYIGNVNHSNIHATQMLFEYIRNHKLGEIHLCSGTSPQFLQSQGLLDPPVIYHGFLPEAAFYSLFQICDFALLAHGLQGALSDTEYQTILPTRLVTLLFSQLPIIALVPKNSALNVFLKKHDCAWVMNNEDELATINNFAVDFQLQQQKVNRALALVPSYNIDNIADQILRM